MVLRLLVFLGLNFGALALGSLLMGKGAGSDWYLGLEKAPWTPPGWVFGLAWFSIMLFFSIYMAKAYSLVHIKSTLVIIYGLQLLLNIVWNPLFFRWHLVLTALIIIVALTFTVAYLMVRFGSSMKYYSLLILPYLLWLLIAISLNAYIYVKNL